MIYLRFGLSLAAAAFASVGCSAVSVAESAFLTSWVELVALPGTSCASVGVSLTRDRRPVSGSLEGTFSVYREFNSN